MMNRSIFIAEGLVLSALACRGDDPSPTEPVGGISAATLSAPLTFYQVSGGDLHTCGITADGVAYCWGAPWYGELGNTVYSTAVDDGVLPWPFPVTTTLRFRQVSAGTDFTCAVTTEYRAYCWGRNVWGQLGDGTTTERHTPVPVAGGHFFRQVDAGWDHACGVTTAGRAYCWGFNSNGQLGDGSTTTRLAPVAVTGGLVFRQVSAGRSYRGFTCGATTTNLVYCWGANSLGQLGDSTEVAQRLRPTRVAAAGRLFRQVEAGGGHACAITTLGRAYCWGDGRNGQLGNGKLYLSFWPRAVATTLTFDRLSAGGVHTCGESADRAYCWGMNAYGQIGDGTAATRVTPVAVAGGLRFAQIGTGVYLTCGKTPAGAAYCWGDNWQAQLGSGDLTSHSTPTPVVGPP